MDIISGLIDIKEGMLYINNKDITNINKSSLVQQINYNMQSFIPINSTIKNNISLFRSFDDPIETICKQFFVYEDIIRLPQKFETRISSDTTILSGGQKQKLGFCRSFLKTRSLNILDDCFSAIDSATAHKIFDNVCRINDDSIFIIVTNYSHFLSKLDQIFILYKGTIIDSGSHEKLLCKNNLYKNIII